MEFHEKLQELRKSRGMTQEELAEVLFVSRTAISKWESGRGYPSIDSLKEISAYFSVSIDQLLSGEKLILIAEKENQSNMQKISELLFGVVDLFFVLLIILPLYPKTLNGTIYSVNLWMYTETAAYNRVIYWCLFVLLIVCGILKIFQVRKNVKNGKKLVTAMSMVFNIAAVLYLVLAREAYAAIVAFLFFMMKSAVQRKYSDRNL